MSEINYLNVYESDRDFYNPDKHPPFPMKRIKGHPYEDIADIDLKMLFMGPFLNGKFLTAFNLYLEAEKKYGSLQDKVVVAYSSGNFATAVFGMAPAFGAANVQLILPRDIAPVKLEQLRLFGINNFLLAPVTRREVLMLGIDPAAVVFDSEGLVNGVELARRMGDRPNWIVFDQYSDPANAAAHEKWTAPQIWEQTGHEVDVIAAGLGTTGTAVGLKNFYKVHSPDTLILGVAVSPEQAVPGIRTEKRLEETGFGYKNFVDQYKEVGANVSFLNSLIHLWRPGSMGGPSAGATLGGVFELCELCRKDSALFNKLRRGKEKLRAVVVGMDTALLYPEKYSRDLSEKQLLPEGGNG